MQWVLDNKYSHLFNQVAFAEEIIVIEEAGESHLIDAMNRIVTGFRPPSFPACRSICRTGAIMNCPSAATRLPCRWQCSR